MELPSERVIKLAELAERKAWDAEIAAFKAWKAPDDIVTMQTSIEGMNVWSAAWKAAEAASAANEAVKEAARLAEKAEAEATGGE